MAIICSIQLKVTVYQQIFTLDFYFQISLIIFQYQTATMFKKKYSQVNMDAHYSPFKLNKMQRNITPQKYNLSPMKTRNNNLKNCSKSPRHFNPQEHNPKYSINKTASNISNNFESQLSFLGNTILTEHQANWQFTNKSSNKNGKFIQEPTTVSNASNYQASERNMKESKRLFTNVISKMNERNNKEGTSQKNSIFQEPKQTIKNQLNSYNKNQNNQVSFKALKQIKMIESVQPLPAPPLLQKSQSQKHQKAANPYSFASCKKMSQWQKNPYLPTQFTESATPQPKQPDQRNKKQKIIQLINNSFSSFLPIDSNLKPKVGSNMDPILNRQIQIFETIQIQQSSDIFDVLMTKIQTKHEVIQEKSEEWIDVKASVESSRWSISMNPYL